MTGYELAFFFQLAAVVVVKEAVWNSVCVCAWERKGEEGGVVSGGTVIYTWWYGLNGMTWPILFTSHKL